MTPTDDKKIADDKLLAEEKEKVRAFARAYAAREGFDINPDEKIVDMVIGGLARNKIKHGARYCPCRIISGDREQDKFKICPCKWHKDEIEKDGHCHCVLFFKRNQD
ncbi:MAG: ferredoxin-thioredoxin reductase catalytic domain-containing protein [Endomicrobiia bacterium]|nr:ferredoxin-thioredoxin reductase catalytic domain-containing protein [Endomicrobiia bacterium]